MKRNHPDRYTLSAAVAMMCAWGVPFEAINLSEPADSVNSENSKGNFHV